MVKTTLVVLVALSGTATAEELDDPTGDDGSPAFNMFGFSASAGGIPLDGAEMTVMSLGLALEHPVFRRTRITAEYDWLWLSRRDARTAATNSTMVPRPDDHGTGHRVSLGLRRELVAKGGSTARRFIDGELGGTVALVNETMAGVSLVPGGFAGVRLGIDLYSRSDDSPSGTFEIALSVRAIAVADGVGFAAGFGMFWGN